MPDTIRSRSRACGVCQGPQGQVARRASDHNNQISVVIEPWAPHHFRGLFSSMTPHVAAAVIPPSAMSTKTSSGVPRVIILATLVVLATSVAVVPHVGVGRCDGHHKMVDLQWTCQWQLVAVVSMSKSLAQTNKSLARRPEQIDGQDESLACWLGPGRVYQLDSKTEKQVPKAMIGRRLSQEEANRLLAKFE